MTRRRSSILTYHSLDNTGSVISVSPGVFQEQMKWLAESGTPVVPLTEITKTPGAVAITFDDGFRSFHQHALPVLTRYGFPATVFVVSGRCGEWNGWNQPVPGIPRLALMSWSEVESAAAAGVTIGAHTLTHRRLFGLDDALLDREMAGCRAAIEDRIGRAVDTFAYPYGALDARAREAARRHFRIACGVRLDFVAPQADLLELPRLDVYYLQSRRLFEGLGHPGGAAYIAARRWIREFRLRPRAAARHA